MSSFNRRIFILGSAALAGCGFSPVYNSTEMQNLSGKIAFDTPNSRDSFALRNQLERRLGQAQAPRYGLSYAIETSSQQSAVAYDGQSYRQQIQGKVTYALRSLSTSQVAISGTETAFVGYATTGTTTATQAAERDANARLMIQLADQIVIDIMFRTAEVAP